MLLLERHTYFFISQLMSDSVRRYEPKPDYIAASFLSPSSLFLLYSL